MQPYFLPYIGYFQLIASVDRFILYDNIKYTKRGWINRNRMLLNGSDIKFSLPLKNDSDSLFIDKREIAKDFDAAKLLNQFKGAYHHAPYFNSTFLLLEEIITNKELNLFTYLEASIKKICKYLEINTEILDSSSINIDHSLKGQDRVIAICKASGASIYVNAIGGVELYSKEVFLQNKLELKFLKSLPFEYQQFNNVFVPWLSIIDVLMFNSLDVIRKKIYSNHIYI